jgi:hypothetical protein
MKAGKYDDLVIGHKIDQTVWETAQSGSANLLMNRLILVRIPLNDRYTAINGTKKFSPETFTAVLIPIDCLTKDSCNIN